jgi:hypothetical protein
VRVAEWQEAGLLKPSVGFALPPEARETLREEVIKQYGKVLELIADRDPPGRSRRRRRKKKKS